MTATETETRRDYIARRLSEGARQADIAGELGVTRQRVHQIASDMPAPCRCGCGGLIPVAAPGHRVYLEGHWPVARCGCGAMVSRDGRRCHACHAADQFGASDLTGRTFGSWVVLGLVYPLVQQRSGNHRLWWCRCGCGAVRAVWHQNLVRGLSGGCRACGYRRRAARRAEKSA